MADIAFEKDLSVAETGIGGLKVVDLAVHGDSRGWFKENWQRAKMCALGIPDLRVVQNNVSYNDSRGVTRGIHAEPWDKFISVARGSVFGAWVDLREGSETYGKVYTCTLDRPRPSTSRAAWATPSRPWRTAPPTPTWWTPTGRWSSRGPTPS